MREILAPPYFKIELGEVLHLIINDVVQVTMFLYSNLNAKSKSAVIAVFRSKHESSPPNINFDVKLLVDTVDICDLWVCVCD